MQELTKFKGTPIEFLNLNGAIYVNPYDVGKCLELSDSAVRMAVSKMNKNQAVKLTKSIVKNIDNYVIPPSGKLFLTESGMYKLAFRSNKPEAEEFTNWVSDEVLPSIRKTGSYQTAQIKKAISERPYEYFDKTYNGQPVLTSADVTYFTGIGKDSINYHLRTNDFIYGQDYYIVKSRDLERFKAENPNKYPGVWIMNLITESGFNKICEKYGILTDKPKCFIQEKNPSKEPSVISKICDKYNIELHALTEKTAKYFGRDMKTAVGQEFTVKKDGRYHIFYDTSADKYERQLMVSRGIGAVLTGQFREHDNDVDYTEEARIFSVVLSALAMFSEFGGFSQPNK